MNVKGLAFLDKALFTNFRFHHSSPPHQDTELDTKRDSSVFQISLAALLETLQIFGSSESKERSFREPSYTNDTTARSGAGGPFDSRVLGLSGSCRLQYEGLGHPLCITLEEGNVSTVCKLMTYEPEYVEDIPFDREQLAQKIIMRSSWLYDAVSELNSTSPERLTISASPSAPHFSLSAAGPLGSAAVDFSKDAQLLETYQVPRFAANSYKFSLISAATKAMAIAAKVSIRCDVQGVLSLQFMIEVEDGSVSFVDFRFVPFVGEDLTDADEGEESESED